MTIANCKSSNLSIQISRASLRLPLSKKNAAAWANLCFPEKEKKINFTQWIMFSEDWAINFCQGWIYCIKFVTVPRPTVTVPELYKENFMQMIVKILMNFVESPVFIKHNIGFCFFWSWNGEIIADLFEYLWLMLSFLKCFLK